MNNSETHYFSGNFLASLGRAVPAPAPNPDDENQEEYLWALHHASNKYFRSQNPAGIPAEAAAAVNNPAGGVAAGEVAAENEK